MKRATQILSLLMLVAGVLPADIVNVQFGSLSNPINIGQPYNSLDQNYSTIDNLTIHYEPDTAAGSGLNCGFDVALGGIQAPGCLGAQIDSSGIYGTTDGSLVLEFTIPANSMAFPFGLINYDGMGGIDDFFVTALFFLRGGYVGPAPGFTVAGSAPVFALDSNGEPTSVLISSGNFSYGPSGPFDSVVINFSPTFLTDDLGNVVRPYGFTTFQLDGLSYNETPEPASITLFAIGLLAVGASRVRRRRQ